MLQKKYLLIVLLSAITVCFGFIISPADNETKLKQIAKEYKSFTLHRNTTFILKDKSDTASYKWTVAMCASGMEGYHTKVDSIYLSKVIAGQSPHGDKLYKMYVKDYASYTGSKEQPLGQVIVKETWNVKEVKYDKKNTKIVQVQSKNNGKWFTPTTKSELFIMYKENESGNNDKGWVYGIVNLEDINNEVKVLSNGKLSNCISCHVSTKYDRIFGVK